MRPGFPVLLMLLATQAGAQTFASMGRLFTTPAERAQLDAQRSQAPNIALSARSGPGEAAVAGSLPGSSAAAPCAAVSAPGCPPLAAPAVEGAAGAPEAPDQSVQEAPGVRLDGVIRRSNGPAVLIVNGEVQPAPAGGVMRGAVTIRADGRSIVLKPGQRYDSATGEVHEAAR